MKTNSISHESRTEPVSSQGRLTSRKKTLFITIVMVFNVIVLVFGYVGFTLWRCRPYSRAHSSRWMGSAYEINEHYGYFPKTNHIAYHTLRYGEKVPVLFNNDGFRISVNPEPHLPAPDESILFLGCSLTFGEYLPAEKTFAYLASRQLRMECLNGGASGWGLAHVVLRARREIPRLRPTWVVVQYTDFLLKRAMEFYGPSYWGKSPQPYFYQAEGRERLLIHDPVFMSANFRYPISEYAGTGLLSFFWHVGLPLLAYDDLHIVITSLRRRLGILPLPVSSRAVVVNFAYSEIHRLCEQEGASMLILKLPYGYSENAYQVYKDDLPDLECPIVDTYPVLLDALPEKSEAAWDKEYRFWRGNPLQIVDRHPNSKAHALIAEAVVQAIERYRNQDMIGPNK